MNTLTNEILESIENIETVTMEAEMNVLTSLCDVYSKASIILENYEGEDYSCFDIFQESVILESDDNAANKSKDNILKKIWNGLKAILKKFFSFLKRKCKYTSLLIKMKLNPDEEVFCPLPLQKTYDAYVTFDEWIGKVLAFVEDVNPEEINDASKMANQFWKKRDKMGVWAGIPFQAIPHNLRDLKKEYERLDEGEEPHDESRVADAGDKRRTKFSKRYATDFYRNIGKSESIKSIIENIEKLNNIRESISKKVESLLKIFDKYDSISSDNEYVNSVLEYYSHDYKDNIVGFMKLDTVLERCLTNQFTSFLEYSKKHKKV
jgi:hypothetical protein